MGRSKRPPSLGRSAGARFTVMRPAGNSKSQCASAARTRSLLSRTTGAGKPDDGKGRQAAAQVHLHAHQRRGHAHLRATQYLCEAHAPTLRPRAGVEARGLTARIAPFLLQLRHPRLERCQQLATAQQHPRLGVELLATHQVETLAAPTAAPGRSAPPDPRVLPAARPAAPPAVAASVLQLPACPCPYSYRSATEHHFGASLRTPMPTTVHPAPRSAH